MGCGRECNTQMTLPETGDLAQGDGNPNQVVPFQFIVTFKSSNIVQCRCIPVVVGSLSEARVQAKNVSFNSKPFQDIKRTKSVIAVKPNVVDKE
jgi:hypothetical protein